MIDQPDQDAAAVPFRPTAISLFAGAGGCSLGFGQAGYDVRFATDLDADAVESYRRNFPGTPCETADIRQLTAEAVLQRLGLNPGELDLLLGGPPGQGFSSAGVKAGDDPRNSLLSHYVRLLEGIGPKWFVMENVEGLLTSGGGWHVRDTVAAFFGGGLLAERGEGLCARPRQLPANLHFTKMAFGTPFIKKEKLTAGDLFPF